MDQIRMAVIPHRRDVGSLVETPLGESYRRSLIFTPIAALGFSFCMQKYALYILYSQSLDIYYKGISHHPELRLKYHNSSSKGWTKRGIPWVLVFCKYFDSKQEAQYWERKIKKIKKRAIIESIINGQFDWIK